MRGLWGVGVVTVLLLAGTARAAGPEPGKLQRILWGEIAPEEQEEIDSWGHYVGRQAEGDASAIMPRGGRPKRAPTYRFLYWTGDIGDSSGRIVSPFSITFSTIWRVSAANSAGFPRRPGNGTCAPREF